MELKKVEMQFELGSVDDVLRAANLVLVLNGAPNSRPNDEDVKAYRRVCEAKFLHSTREEEAQDDFYALCGEYNVLDAAYAFNPDTCKGCIISEDEEIRPSLAEEEPEALVEAGAVLILEVLAD